MKKRTLGLLLALCLVVGLLPMAALAEETPAANPDKIHFCYASSYIALGKRNVNAGTTLYLTTYTPDGTTNVCLTTTGADENNWSVKFEYPTTGAATLTMKNLTMNGPIGITYGTYTNGNMPTADKVTCNVPLNVVLEGTNTMTVTHGNQGLDLCTKGDVTFSGTGSLTINANRKISNNSGVIAAFGNLTFDNTNVTINVSEAGNASHGIAAIGGDITVKGGNIALNGVDTASDKNYYETFRSGFYADNVTVQDGAKVTFIGTTYGDPDVGYVVNTTGAFTVKNADVELAVTGYYSTAKSKLLAALPTLTFDGGYTVVASTTAGTWDATEGFTAPTKTDDYATADVAKLVYLKVTHTCVAGADDKDCTTGETCGVCGKEMSESQANHNIPTDDGDCTTAVKCQNAGCEHVEKAAEAAHNANGATQADCTVAVKCTNTGCTKDAIAAKEHTPANRTDCSVAANCTVCGKEALAAGQHSGGTATCKAKAKCASCGKEYGELAACTPAADDGDCTTAIKCSVCGKETTAAKTHAYTDNTDASCNNAGCTKTRVVETPNAGTNGSPQTGDSMNLVLWFSILAVSAIGFVSVVIFSKKRAA